MCAADLETSIPKEEMYHSQKYILPAFLLLYI